MKTQSEQVLSIQYLRGFAALMVIVHHALDQFSGFKYSLPTDTGASGVDIFFVISGFVMTYTAKAHNYTRSEFLLRRAVRIVPIYWIVTVFTATLLVFGAGLVRHSIISPIHLLASLLFFPMYNPGEPLSISPVLKLGWTLNYEVFFYLLFAVFLFFRPRSRTMLIALLFAVMCLGARVLPAAPAPLIFWGSPIVFEFLCGCVLAELYFSGMLKRIRRPLLGVAGMAGIVGLIFSGFGSIFGFDPVGSIRIAAFGLPTFFIVASFVGLEQTSNVRKKHSLLRYVGDASYSIYLTHLFAVIFMRIVWSRLGLPTEGLGFAFVFIGGCFVTGAGLGCLTYVAVERPATAWAKALLIPKSVRQAPALP